MTTKAEKAAEAKAAEAAPDDGSYFLHATAGSRTMLTRAEYDGLVKALDDMRADHGKKGAKHK